jgi:putative aldouronate transport system permease protein
MAHFRESRARRAFCVVNYVGLSLLVAVTALPMLYVIVVSFISPDDFQNYGISWPHHWSLANYQELLGGDSAILQSYRNTMIITVVGTAISLIATTMLAYVLSRRGLPGRHFLTLAVFFTMLFSGGLIPTFLVVKSVGLLDTLWALMIPQAVSAYYFLIMRTYFAAFPIELEEAGRIDGANDLTIFFRLVLPLSRPILATIALFYAIDRWNDYFSALIYLTQQGLYPVQLVLYNLISQTTSIQLIDPSQLAQTPTTPEMAQLTAVVIATVPIMLVYPFVQRYFVQGVMIGSLKE